MLFLISLISLIFLLIIMILFRINAICVLLGMILAFCTSIESTASISLLPLDPSQAHYLEVTGGDRKPFDWKVTQRGDGNVVVVMESNGVRFENFCRKTGETLEWRYSNGAQTQIFAKRTENQIIIHGTRLGKPVDEIIEIDERPWYQPLSYSLRNFLFSDQQQTSFWTIRTETLDVHALNAKKIREEKIDTVAGPTIANHVEVRLDGILSALWHATYWYRGVDGLFLRYHSVHGAVGTDSTEVTIASAVVAESD